MDIKKVIDSKINNIDDNIKNHKKFNYVINKIIYNYNKNDNNKTAKCELNLEDNGKLINIIITDENEQKKAYKEFEISIQDNDLIVEETEGIHEKGLLSIEYINSLYDKNGIELSRNIYSDYLRIPKCYSLKDEILNFKPVVTDGEVGLPKMANHARVININRDYEDLSLATVTMITDLMVLNNKSKYSGRKREILRIIQEYPDVLYTLNYPIYASYDFINDRYVFNGKVTKAKSIKELKDEHKKYFINKLIYNEYDKQNKELYDLIVKEDKKYIKK